MWFIIRNGCNGNPEIITITDRVLQSTTDHRRALQCRTLQSDHGWVIVVISTRSAVNDCAWLGSEVLDLLGGGSSDVSSALISLTSTALGMVVVAASALTVSWLSDGAIFCKNDNMSCLEGGVAIVWTEN